jgi:hypothetical protein
MQNDRVSLCYPDPRNSEPSGDRDGVADAPPVQ